MASVSAGQILLIKEIIQDISKYDGASVRIVGTLCDMDLASNYVVLTHEGCEIRVDTSVLGDLAFRPTSLYQFIGEVRVKQETNPEHACVAGTVCVRARVGRCVDGMDMGLFIEALNIRRKFLGESPIL